MMPGGVDSSLCRPQTRPLKAGFVFSGFSFPLSTPPTQAGSISFEIRGELPRLIYAAVRPPSPAHRAATHRVHRLANSAGGQPNHAAGTLAPHTVSRLSSHSRTARPRGNR